MAGEFELFKDTAGKFWFRLKAGNREVIAASEAYESKSSALNGIESVRKNAADAEIGDKSQTSRSRLVLRAAVFRRADVGARVRA